MEINTTPIRDRLTKITRRYNPEWDVTAEAPSVVWVSNELAEICMILVNQIDVLQDRIKEIENDLDAVHVQYTKGKDTMKNKVNDYYYYTDRGLMSWREVCEHRRYEDVTILSKILKSEWGKDFIEEIKKTAFES